MSFLLLVLLSFGDDKKPVDVVCPADGHRFTALEVTVTNQWGGVDLDFCPHAFKTTPLEFFVWVCPGCKFAGRKRDFAGKLSEGEKKALLAGLRPEVEIKKAAKQGDIPGFVKYDLLAQAARLRGLPPEEAGKAYLHAAWSCRQQGAVYLDGFDEWEALRTGYGLNRPPLEMGLDKNKKAKNRTEFELEVVRKVEKDIEARKFSGINRTLSRYLAAYLYRKHGENAEAERWLADLETYKGENSVVEDAAARMRLSIARERDFQKKAIDSYAAAVADGVAKPSYAEFAYLLGELHRRTGAAKPASEWYRKAIDATASEALKEWALRQKSLVDR